MIIKYSPVARKKLAQMKKTIGSDKVGIIVKAISDLKFNPLKCPTVIRLAWVIFTLAGGSGLIAYIIAAIIMPEDPGYIDM